MKTFASTLELVRAGHPVLIHSRETLIEIRPRTVPWSAVARLAGKLKISPIELLSVVGIAPRTALRRQKEGYLKPDEADRLLRVARIFEESVRIFGTEDKAARWLTSSSAALGDVLPITLLDSDAGTQIVSDELGRIDFGDFA
jgi:putative toxin-antitoxin system antitoxin component (TIGR02293 family)